MVQTGRMSAAELALLLAPATDDSGELQAALDAFSEAAGTAVASFLGVTVSFEGGRSATSCTWSGGGVRGLDAAPASLAFSLPDRKALPGSRWVLYAARSGAFVDLAADLAWLLDSPLSAIELDADLASWSDRRVTGRAADALRTETWVNQALGVLLGRGQTPEDAELTLDGLTAEHGGDRGSAARDVLCDLD